VTRDDLVPAPEEEHVLSIDRLRELYQDACGAVLAGAVRCGANEFTGVSKDDAIDYAAAFLRVADQLFDRVGRSAVGTKDAAGQQRQPGLSAFADYLNRLVDRLGFYEGSLEGRPLADPVAEQVSAEAAAGVRRGLSMAAGLAGDWPSLSESVEQQRLQGAADLLIVVAGHQPARSVWEALNDGQRELLADLIDESHRRHSQDVGMPESFVPVDRWWRGGTGG
jgi:hypothetical protein